MPGGPDREVAQASAAAVATFWGSVVAFAETVERVPRGWPDDLPTDHPFLAVRGGKVVVPRVPQPPPPCWRLMTTDEAVAMASPLGRALPLGGVVGTGPVAPRPAL